MHENDDLVPAAPVFTMNRVTRRRIFGAAAGSLAVAAGARPSYSFNYAGHFINQLLTQLFSGRRGAHIDTAILLLLLQFLILVALRFGRALHHHYRFSHLTGSSVTGGAEVPFTTPEVRSLAEQIYRDSLGHVRVVRATLRRRGVQPVEMPAVNLGKGFGSEADFLSESFVIIAIILALFVLLQGRISNHHILSVISRLIGSYGSFSGALGTRSAGAGGGAPALDAKSAVPTLENQLPTDADGLVGERTIEEAIAALAPYFPNGLAGLSPDKFEQIKRTLNLPG